ncbi:MAG: NADPH-dependent F420 reductase [Dehalococcoidia bacterium]
MKIAILGGTGDEGLGLAMRWAKSGDEVIIGSRSAERALEAAHKVRDAVPFGHVTGMANDAASEAAEVVIVSVPYGGQRDTLLTLAPALTDKVVISVVVPLQFGKGGPKPVRVAEGSAAEEASAILPNSRVASAFHNLSATKLMEVDSSLDCDVVVCSDHAEAKRVTVELAEKLEGVRALDGGGLGYSSVVEDLTALLISLNRRYKAHASVKFTGISAGGAK